MHMCRFPLISASKSLRYRTHPLKREKKKKKVNNKSKMNLSDERSMLRVMLEKSFENVDFDLCCVVITRYGSNDFQCTRLAFIFEILRVDNGSKRSLSCL